MNDLTFFPPDVEGTDSLVPLYRLRHDLIGSPPTVYIHSALWVNSVEHYFITTLFL